MGQGSLMRTEKYSRYLARMRSLLDVDTFLDSEREQLLSHFQRNIRWAWEAYDWPELVVTELRVPDGLGVIELDGGGGDEDIGEVFVVWDDDPRSAAGACEVPFQLTSEGLQIPRGQYDSVYVEFRVRVPDYYGDDYDSTTTYEVDDQVYYPSTGKFYRAFSETTGNDPTDQSKWVELEIPYCLFEYVVQASYADQLLALGFNDKARYARVDAQAWLDQETDKLSRQQRQPTRHAQIRTHGTMQLRTS